MCECVAARALDIDDLLHSFLQSQRLLQRSQRLLQAHSARTGQPGNLPLPLTISTLRGAGRAFFFAVKPCVGRRLSNRDPKHEYACGPDARLVALGILVALGMRAILALLLVVWSCSIGVAAAPSVSGFRCGCAMHRDSGSVDVAMALSVLLAWQGRVWRKI